MSKNKNLDELFREKFQNFEQEPPAHLLENVLAGAASARRKKKFIFWRVAGVAAAILLAFVAGWQLNDGRIPVTGKSQTATISVQKSDDTRAKSINETKPVTKIADQTVQENKQLAANSKSTLKRNTKSPQPTVNQKSEIIVTTTESDMVTTSENKPIVLEPLKQISHILNQTNESENELQEIAKQEAMPETVVKSIDQQIMEQNQKMLLAENSGEQKVRWTVGAQVSPAYSVSRSSHSQAYASNMLNSSSSNPVELGGGLSVELKKGKRWSLQSGVYYSGLGQTSDNTAGSSSNKDYAFADRGAGYFNTSVNIIDSKMSMNSSAGIIEFSSVPSGIVLGTSLESNALSSAVVVSETKFTQNFEYIEIPLFLRYTLLDSRFDIELLGGFSSNVLIGNETYLESNSSKSLIGTTKDMEALSYSGTVGFGLKYGLSKRIFLNVEPRIKYYLNSLNSNSSVTYKPYTIGIYSGISYQF